MIAIKDPVLRREADIIIHGITQGLRFYMPAGPCVFKTADGEYKLASDVMRLPYPLIAILSESKWDDYPGNSVAVIVVASVPGTGSFQIVAAQHHADPGWLPQPLCLVSFIDNSGGWKLSLLNTPLTNRYIERFKNDPPQVPITLKELILNSLGADITNIQNLLVMLSLHNTKTKIINPPEKLNAKRKRNGKLPLYSYHVLDVDGEIWDTSGRDDGDGHGYRSHLRRGHIRRIASERCVWVRATFVHGRIQGFVDKDYNVIAPNEKGAG